MEPIKKMLVVDIPERMPEVHVRVLKFKPEKVYKRISLNVFKRQQYVCINRMFPNKPGCCACGCRKKLTGRQSRYATEKCRLFCFIVFAIVTGRSDTIRRIFINLTNGGACMCCGNVVDRDEEAESRMVSYYDLDHIVGVKEGGGGCWLGNYQLICRSCHKEKTKREATFRAARKKQIEVITFDKL